MPKLDTNSTADDVLQGVDLSRKVALVTGASGGLGLETARALTAAGATVVIAARDVEKTRAAVQSIRERVPTASLENLELDLHLARQRALLRGGLSRGPRPPRSSHQQCRRMATPLATRWMASSCKSAPTTSAISS
jgi:NAD(P)-dependent dehydrogenase (short-subunit alcohol dehydrogenase family)